MTGNDVARSSKDVASSESFRTVRRSAEETFAALEPAELARRIGSIQSVSDAALAHLKLDALLDALLVRLRDALRVDVLRILLCEPAGNVLRVRAALGLHEDGDGPVPVPIGQGISGWVAHNRTAVIVDDVERLRIVSPLVRQLRSAMVAPLLVEGELIGVLKVGTAEPRIFEEADLALLQMVADRVALAVDRAQRYQALERAERGMLEERHRQDGLMAQLEAERARLRAVLQQMPAGVIIREAPSGRLVQGNSRAEEILGHPVREMPGSADSVQPIGRRPDGTPVLPTDWPVTRVLATGEPVSDEEIAYRRGDGREVWIRVSAAPIRDDSDRTVAAVAVLHDIEQEKRAEAEMRFLGEVSTALHATLDYPATLRQVARLAVPVFADLCVVDVVDEGGRVRRQEAAHREPRRERRLEQIQARYPTRYDEDGHPIGEVLRTGEPLLLREVPADLPDRIGHDEEHARTIRELDMSSIIVVPMPGRERVLGAIVFARTRGSAPYHAADLAVAEEIGRRAATAIENAELYETASEANRAKLDFLAVMSHELRTPLAAIMGYAELLQMGIPVALPEAAVHQVERIDSAARHQLQLIEEILTYSRLSAGEESVVSMAIDIAGPVRDAVAFIRPAAEKKGLALHEQLPADPIEVETDGGKVQQVLVNLLFNAVQFTSSGEIRVEIEAGAAEDEVRITVADTGIGIASEHQAKVFDPFWQVRQSSTREVGGTGLGLTVAQRTLQALGGKLELQSQEGRGSRFTVRIPRRPSAAPLP